MQFEINFTARSLLLIPFASGYDAYETGDRPFLPICVQDLWLTTLFSGNIFKAFFLRFP